MLFHILQRSNDSNVWINYIHHHKRNANHACMHLCKLCQQTTKCKHQDAQPPSYAAYNCFPKNMHPVRQSSACSWTYASLTAKDMPHAQAHIIAGQMQTRQYSNNMCQRQTKVLPTKPSGIEINPGLSATVSYRNWHTSLPAPQDDKANKYHVKTDI